MNWVYAWIGGCVVLHNLLLDLNEPWEPNEDEIAAILEEEGVDNGDADGDEDGEGPERPELSEVVNNGRRDELFLEYLRVRAEQEEVY
ncbi:MAG: hypothetical protein JWM47_4478 [Acidimicrobiales bacterium]|nr:hypothetical protein [Acidimicrobiales bacterium]